MFVKEIIGVEELLAHKTGFGSQVHAFHHLVRDIQLADTFQMSEF